MWGARRSASVWPGRGTRCGVSRLRQRRLLRFSDGLVATVRRADREQREEGAFYREMQLLSHLNHRHLVRLRGFSEGHNSYKCKMFTAAFNSLAQMFVAGIDLSRESLYLGSEEHPEHRSRSNRRVEEHVSLGAGAAADAWRWSRGSCWEALSRAAAASWRLGAGAPGGGGEAGSRSPVGGGEAGRRALLGNADGGGRRRCWAPAAAARPLAPVA